MSTLVDNCKETKNQINNVINWVNDNLDSDEARPVLSVLKDLRASSRNLEKVADKKPTLSVYGESQIGKSYFMSELLKNRSENRFYLKFKTPQSKYANFFNGEYLDYLARVNPDGGKESSGIVTRFTISQDAQKPDAQIPVKFLRQVDIAMILIDTYAKDIQNTDQLNDYEYSEIVNILQQLSALSSHQDIDGMDENDMVDFKNYLNKYLQDGFYTIQLFNKNKLWDDVISLLPKIPYNQRYKLFEIFWGKIRVFTEIFNKLSEVLKLIDFEQEGHLELDALLPKEMNGKKSSIIDVGTLSDFYSIEKLPPLNIHTSKGVIPNIGIGEVTAIVREMTLSVDDRILENESRKFLNEVDVYDFPGARNRKEYDVSRIASLNSIHDSENDNDDNILHECITRGKVSYLFNYYSDMNDITTLIFAQKNSNQEVNTLPKQIDNWVVNSHGDNPNDRDINNMNLFISFHFFNIELNGKPSDMPNDIEQYNGLWTNRLEVNVEKFIGKQIRKEDNWIENWANGKRFKNFFFLRDPNPSFNTATRIDENGNEVYNTGYEQKHRDMKQSFLTSAIVSKYIENPAELWAYSATLNNTGTEYIIKSITPVTTKQRREEQIKNRLSKILEKILEKIAPFYKSGNYDEELKLVTKNTADSIKDILISMKTKNSFGNILFNLELPEDLAWKTLYDVENPIFIHNIKEDGSITSESTLGMTDNSTLIDVDIDEFGDEFDIDFGDSDEMQSKEIDIHAKHKTKSEIFADKLVVNWLEYVEENFSEESLRKLSISKSTIDWMLVNLKESLERVEFKNFLASEIESEMNKYMQNTDIIFLISRLTKNYFNDFINTYGWNHIEINQRPFMKNGSILFYNQYKKANSNYVVKSLNHDDIKLNNTFPGSELLNHWLKGFQEATKENLNFRYKDGGVIKNPEANTKLGSIIESLKQIN